MKGKKRKGRRTGFYRQMIGRECLVPANFFGIDVPGMYYRFRIVHRDKAHRDAMTVVSLDEKGPKNWIPTCLIRQWLQEADENSHISRRYEESDQYAAETLLELKHYPVGSEAVASLLGIHGRIVKEKSLGRVERPREREK